MSGTTFFDGDTADDLPAAVDVLIVGSGPVGSTFARRIADLTPRARTLMVEVGPRLTARPGMHVRNIADDREREVARRRSEGPKVWRPIADSPSSKNDVAGPVPGTFFVSHETARGDSESSFPAAAMSCNVGGMGSHWAGSVPAPYGRERIGFIPDHEWNEVIAVARRLLAVSSGPLVNSTEWQECLTTVSRQFDGELPPGRGVQNMPIACRIGPNGGAPYWTGSDVILGELACRPRETFAIAAQTLCRELLVDDGRVAGAVLENRVSGRRRQVLAKAVIIAADSLRTPQLLWASRIRPRALGHYLNDHLVVVGAFTPKHLVAPADSVAFTADALTSGRVGNVGWVPYMDDVHPFHGQFSQVEAPSATGRRNPGMVFYGYFLPKDIRFEDRVLFLDEHSDSFGMPGIAFDYGLSKNDRAGIDHAKNLIGRAAQAFGSDELASNTSMWPGGASLHYMGTTRMGAHDDGDSVCDSYSRVWGYENLFVGGNGVIPTPIACNPTLTSVALAARAAVRVAILTA